MKTVKLYYFSGSGNTYTIANKVREVFEPMDYNCEVMSIEDVEKVEIEEVAYIGLLFPVAIQSTFPNVWAFINDLPEASGQKIFMIDTMAYFSGGIVGPVKKVLQGKGYSCEGAIELKMSSSLNTKNIDLKSLHEKNEKATLKIERFITELVAGKSRWLRMPVLSDMMRNISIGRAIWTKHSEKITIDHESCINCNLCIKRCPTHSMSTIDGIVTINHGQCVSCMRCIHICPKDAFYLSGRKVIRL